MRAQRFDLRGQAHFLQHRIGVLPDRRRVAPVAAGRARELGHDAGHGERLPSSICTCCSMPRAW
jgi:hypothetical protein